MVSYREGAPRGFAAMLISRGRLLQCTCTHLRAGLEGHHSAISQSRNALIARLNKVRTVSHNFGYGVGDDMDSLLAKYVGECGSDPRQSASATELPRYAGLPEAHAVGDPVMPVADGFQLFRLTDGGSQLRQGNGHFPAPLGQRDSTSMSCSQTFSAAMRKTSMVSPFLSGGNIRRNTPRLKRETDLAFQW